MRTPEGQLKHICHKYLDSIEGLWRYSPVSAGYGKHGVPDDIICYKGLFLTIEYKSPKAHPTPLQRVCHQELLKANAASTIAWSLDDVKNLIEKGIGIVPLPTKGYETKDYQV